LEVQALTGRSISSWQSETRGAADDYRWLRHALWPADRVAHGATLARRIDAMLQAGFCEEVRRLYVRGDLHESLPAIRSVGYRQLWEWCAGRATSTQARERAVTATRQLSKRQMTWLRAEVGMENWSLGTDEEFLKWRKNVLTQLEHG
jgi:tRNA dimethylallyltransferase